MRKLLISLLVLGLAMLGASAYAEDSKPLSINSLKSGHATTLEDMLVNGTDKAKPLSSDAVKVDSPQACFDEWHACSFNKDCCGSLRCVTYGKELLCRD